MWTTREWQSMHSVPLSCCWWEKVTAGAADAVVTRAHFAAAMRAKGYVQTWDEAFDKYLGPGGDAYFDKARLTFTQAFAVIHDAGGLASLAHVVHLMVESDVELEVLIGRLVDSGLDGIEAFHPDHSPKWVRITGEWLAEQRGETPDSIGRGLVAAYDATFRGGSPG